MSTRGSGNIVKKDKTLTIVPTSSKKWTTDNAFSNTVDIRGRMKNFKNINEQDLYSSCQKHDSTDYTNYDWTNPPHNASNTTGVNISNVAYDLAMKEYGSKDKAEKAKKLASDFTCVEMPTEFSNAVLKSVERVREK